MDAEEAQNYPAEFKEAFYQDAIIKAAVDLVVAKRRLEQDVNEDEMIQKVLSAFARHECNNLFPITEEFLRKTLFGGKRYDITWKLSKHWKPLLIGEKHFTPSFRNLARRITKVKGVQEYFSGVPTQGGTDVSAKKKYRYKWFPDELGAEEDKLLTSIRSSVEGQASRAVWTAGGAIPISKIASQDGHSSAPISLFWESTDGSAKKVVFPSENGIAALYDDCQPATFGRQGESVYDETYRKALKLDASRFASTFSPWESGIVSIVSQMLLPSFSKAASSDDVRVELYKLNIYAGPSGKFKSHVDTPRATNQFGSLVVSLPCPHQGGELLVRHKGEEKTFDWSNTAADKIEWAAFYSDCEHEVLEVREGYRVTLTYNLYFAEPTIVTRNPTLDITSLPLYKEVQASLQSEDFFKKGSLFAFCLDHSYAHTSGAPASELPLHLKGADMALFAVFKALGLKARVKPYVNQELWRRDKGVNSAWARDDRFYRIELGHDEAETDPSYDAKAANWFDYYWDDDPDNFRGSSSKTQEVEPLEKRLRLMYVGMDLTEEGPDSYKDFDTRLEHLLKTRKVRGMVTHHEAGALRRFKTIQDLGFDYDGENPPNFHDLKFDDLLWVTEHKHRELSHYGGTYGNEPSVAIYYTWATLIVVIPPWSEQRGRPELLQEGFEQKQWYRQSKVPSDQPEKATQSQFETSSDEGGPHKGDRAWSYKPLGNVSRRKFRRNISFEQLLGDEEASDRESESESDFDTKFRQAEKLRARYRNNIPRPPTVLPGAPITLP